MRILAAGSNRNHQRGLSLVELLVVLIVIGLISGVAVMAIAPRASEAERAATRFAGTVEQLLDMAIVEARPVGIDVAATSISVRRFSAGSWQAVALPRTAGARVTDVSLELSVSDEFDLPEADDNDSIDLMFRQAPAKSAETTRMPVIVFSPVGEVTPFTLMFAGQDENWFVTVDRFASVEVRRGQQ
ncbi:type II secretion system minor pseudopilin GspH [Parvularcula sp. LCG005]|uniref:type II secretion system minor pseudopilin GspH n=1 Tax=Parvularcula sp. LCG005 TaxID=3078805 RepID=UPI0029420E80|nr:type II secretion system minor pseudopilin GspH [Parvularcula sp. LCG005]WOI54371.1 type II secretion system minor pseudopilin GspH [Parvularcula sp. LCG005]